ncbi:MAG: ATP-binding cassette domain-containing protein [Erythrobacter sp.]
MTTATQDMLLSGIALLAQANRTALPPGWQSEINSAELTGDAGDLARVCRVMGWPMPVSLASRPRPDQLPVLAYCADRGWAVAEQWDNENQLKALGSEHLLDYSEALSFFHVSFPDPAQDRADVTARSVFWRAIMRRKGVLLSAALATIIVNLLALATSLFSMQVFDRVIPLASYSTLLVLIIGTMVALSFDFVLRTVRALMIEREAAEIDFEVSEFFFARSQALRMDARPPGVGTLAAQLRGLEQVRSIMSSGSLFLIADLPFAAFFIAFIMWIGGPVAFVPLLSLPIALLLALLLARLIRRGTDRAQVSGNRKNGLLVESLDAAETIKAARGDWALLGRWNRLVREVHTYEDPVKRISAVAQSVFSGLQQVAYVGIMAVGAYEVGEGRMTAGALLACSIIGGRVNGPLIAQLPGLIVQWSYAKSSLSALDSILKLPTDRSAGDHSLRPDALAGPLAVEAVRFAYPNARENVEIERLTIAEGERVAIIGGVGSGKTTLLRMLSGLYRPHSGTVRIGGLDTAQVADDVLRRHIGYLPQDYRMVNGTLRDNLLLGLGAVADERILAAAAKTGLDQTIAAHEMGLELPIQEGGRGLSGGQRTLVGLTRLLLFNPKLWILDEPTSNLDPNSEARFMEILATDLPPDRTIIIVTHKLQLLNQFERVMVMSRGRVAQDGPRDEVLRRMKTQGQASAPPPAKRPPSTALHPISRIIS